MKRKPWYTLALELREALDNESDCSDGVDGVADVPNDAMRFAAMGEDLWLRAEQHRRGDVRTFLQLCTGNMPPEGHPSHGFGGHRSAKTDYGWIVWECVGAQTPAWLKIVLEYARKFGCSAIEFDRDNQAEVTLPTWDW